jgi:hypothetical protein
MKPYGVEYLVSHWLLVSLRQNGDIKHWESRSESVPHNLRSIDVARTRCLDGTLGL